MTETQRQAILAVHNARAELLLLVIVAIVVIASAIALLWALRFAVIETLLSAPAVLHRSRIARAQHTNDHTRVLPRQHAATAAAPEAEQSRREPMRRAA